MKPQNQFYGSLVRPEHLGDIDERHVTREKFNVCSEGRKCRGELPFEINGETVWQYIYDDGPPDSGRVIVKCTYKIDGVGPTYGWFEEMAK